MERSAGEYRSQKTSTKHVADGDFNHHVSHGAIDICSGTWVLGQSECEEPGIQVEGRVTQVKKLTIQIGIPSNFPITVHYVAFLIPPSLIRRLCIHRMVPSSAIVKY